MNRPFDLFELISAILLGLGATLCSVSSYQNGLWSGKSNESFAQATQVTTKSADSGTFADAQIASDSAVKIRVIEALSRANVLEGGEERDYLLSLASELYLRELSDEAYDDLHLPLEPRKHYDETGELTTLPAEVLFEASKQDFSKTYYGWMYEEKVKRAAEAAELFKEGQRCGTIGDRFALNGVQYAMALFFAGLGLVFKSRVRWAFLALGAIVLGVAITYMARLPWA